LCSFGQYMKSKDRYIENLKNGIAEYLTENTQNSNRWTKRVVGELSKILFGTLTHSDARNYKKHNTELEKEQKVLLHLSKG
jgi:hypothetical protein